MLLEDIGREVLEARRRPDNVLTPAFYDEHLGVVAAHATSLAAGLGADRELVELAAAISASPTDGRGMPRGCGRTGRR